MENNRETKRITLIGVLFKKESIHWIRMGRLFAEMPSIGAKLITYPIIVLIITLFHYAFAGMHTLFEIIMYIINRRQFKFNMDNLYIKSNECLKSLKKPLYA